MNLKNLSFGEVQLVQWQYDMHGGFMSSLWKAISCADGGNLILLSKGYPDEVEAYRRFSSEPGYWEDVQKRAEI